MYLIKFPIIKEHSIYNIILYKLQHTSPLHINFHSILWFLQPGVSYNGSNSV
ncbi:hypothetical protein HanIR_Chr11g0557701 [Helianthus annuus]|nr:hypothetical protein HanIR_Chr11g0557701 [Helianthus annuus]